MGGEGSEENLQELLLEVRFCFVSSLSLFVSLVSRWFEEADLSFAFLPSLLDSSSSSFFVRIPTLLPSSSTPFARNQHVPPRSSSIFQTSPLRFPDSRDDPSPSLLRSITLPPSSFSPFTLNTSQQPVENSQLSFSFSFKHLSSVLQNSPRTARRDAASSSSPSLDASVPTWLGSLSWRIRIRNRDPKGNLRNLNLLGPAGFHQGSTRRLLLPTPPPPLPLRTLLPPLLQLLLPPSLVSKTVRVRTGCSCCRVGASQQGDVELKIERDRDASRGCCGCSEGNEVGGESEGGDAREGAEGRGRGEGEREGEDVEFWSERECECACDCWRRVCE